MWKYIMLRAVLTATALNAAKFMVKRVVLIHSCPLELIKDGGSHFIGSVMQQILKLLQINHLKTTSYHEQCDGAAESYTDSELSPVAFRDRRPDNLGRLCALCQTDLEHDEK
jgi:hypothetical protein